MAQRLLSLVDRNTLMAAAGIVVLFSALAYLVFVIHGEYSTTRIATRATPRAAAQAELHLQKSLTALERHVAEQSASSHGRLIEEIGNLSRNVSLMKGPEDTRLVAEATETLDALGGIEAALVEILAIAETRIPFGPTRIHLLRSRLEAQRGPLRAMSTYVEPPISSDIATNPFFRTITRQVFVIYGLIALCAMAVAFATWQFLRGIHVRNHYLEIFAEAPFGAWVEDWSPVYRYLNRISKDDGTDWLTFLGDHEEVVRTAYNLPIPLNISQTALRVYRAPNSHALEAHLVDSNATDDEIAAYTQIIAAFMEGRTAIEVEAWEKRFDGSLAHIKTVFRIPKAHRGTWSRVYAASEDVTDRHDAEVGMAASQRRLADLASASADWLWETDSEHRFTFVSEPTDDGLGVRPEIVLGKTRESLLAPGFDRKSWDAHAAVLAAHEPFRDFTFLSSDEVGGMRWVSASGVPVFSKDGDFTGYRGVAQDVTNSIEAQKVVAHGRDELRLLADNLPTGVAVLDHERKFVFANKKLEDWYQQSFDKLAGRTVATILGADTAARLHGPTNRALAGHLTTVTERVLYPDGHQRDVEISFVPFPGQTGAPGRCIVVSHDVTEYIRASNELRRSEQRFARYADASADWFWEMDSELRFTYVSPSIERLHDLSREDLIGKTREAVAAPDLSHAAWAEHMAALKSRKPFRDFVYSRKGANGVLSWVSISGVPSFSDDGRFIGYCGTGRVVTEIVETQEAIKRGRDQLQLIADNIPAIVSVLDVERRFSFVNKAVEPRFGLPTSEIIGKTFAEVAGEERDEFLRPFHDRVLAGETIVRTDRNVSYAGADRAFQISYVPQRDEDGKVTQFVVLALDVTDHVRTASELRASEQRLTDFAEASVDWFWETDIEDRFTFLSEPARGVTGINPRDVLGRRREDLLAADFDRSVWDAHTKNLAARLPFRDFTFLRTVESGDSRWISVSGVPVFSPEQEFIGYRGTARDVTGSIEAQRKVTRSRDELRLIADNLPALVAVMDKDLRVVFANKTASDWYARPIADIIGKTVPEAVGEAASAIVEPWHARVLSGETTTFTETIEYPDGKTREVLLSYVPQHDEDGGVSHFIALGHDVTNEKQAQERLRVSEARLQQAAQLTKIGYYVWDSTEDRCLYCSEQHARTHGLTVREYQDRATALDGKLSLLYPGDREAYRKAIGDVRRGIALDIEYRIITPADDVRYVREIVEPVFGELQMVVREIGASQDVTEMRLAELHSNQAQKMQALGQLTGEIAHDFNNLMTPVLLNLELIAEMAPDRDGLRQIVADTISPVRRGAELTRQLLAFGRSQTLSPIPTDVNALILGMTRMLRRTIGDRVTITTELGPTVPLAHIDPGQLENTILNLVLNARDAIGAKGNINIATMVSKITGSKKIELPPGEYVTIRISDNGSGMPEHVQRRAFEPFFSTKDTGKGTGLGLSMVYGFANQSGGSVDLMSAEGNGTLVTLRLPAATGMAATQMPQGDIVQGDGQYILLVEDNDAVRDTTARALTRMGYHIVEARNGMEAQDLISSSTPLDLVFSDISLPGEISGIDIAILAKEIRPGVRVLLTTGYASNKLVDSALPPEVPVMMKPYDLATLANRIRDILITTSGHDPQGG